MTVKIAGAKLAIGTTTAASTKAAFEADTFVVIGHMVSSGEISGERQTSQVANINDGELEMYETVYHPGSIEYSFAYIADDEGQADLEAAYHAGGAHNFRYSLSNGDAVYFRAFVSKCNLSGGGEEDVEKLVVTLTRVKGVPVMARAA